jgi:hypothetical protein
MAMKAILFEAGLLSFALLSSASIERNAITLIGN